MYVPTILQWTTRMSRNNKGQLVRMHINFSHPNGDFADIFGEQEQLVELDFYTKYDHREK